MILEEKHKEFAVKCYAQFMTRTEVTDAFIEEFPDDLPTPIPELPSDDQNDTDHTTVEDELEKEQYFAIAYAQLAHKYQNIYGSDAETKLEQDIPRLNEQIENEYAQVIEKLHNKTHAEKLKMYYQQLSEHEQEVKRGISNQLRRFNITHRIFPKKYRDLFNQTRKEYLNSSYRSEEIQRAETVTTELETLYGYVKQRVFQEGDPKAAAANVRLATTILKAISANNQPKVL